MRPLSSSEIICVVTVAASVELKIKTAVNVVL